MGRKKIERLDTLPTSVEDRERLKKAVGEIVDSQLRMASEKSLVKDIITLLKEDLNMDPKYVRKLAKLHFDESYGEGNVKIDYEHSVQIIEDSEILFK